MTTPTKDPLEDLALALYYRTAELMKAGKTKEQIITELGLQGVRRDTVEKMLVRLKQSQRNVERERGWINVGVGGVMTFLSVGMIFGWFGLPFANGVAIYLVLLALGIGGYWLVKGLLQLSGL